MSNPSFQRVTPRAETEDERTPEDIAAAKRKRFLIVCSCVVIVLGGVVLVNARSISRSIKGWQAERAAREVAGFLAIKDYTSAQAKVRDALALSPQNPAAQLAAARFLSAAGGHREAVGFWKEIEARNPLSVEDQRLYTGSLLAMGDLLETARHLKLLWPADQPGTPEDWMLGLSLALQKRDSNEAILLAGKISNSPSASLEQQFKAATLLTTAPDSTLRKQAWSQIETISRTPAEVGLEALIALARRAAAAQTDKTQTAPVEDPTPESIAAAIEVHPKAQARHFLFAMDLRLLVEPLRKSEMIESAEARFTGNDDDLEALAAWLYGKGEYRKILAHLPPEVAAHRRSLFLQSLDAEAALGEWKSVADAINGASFTLDRVTAEMYLARCSKELGEKSAAENHWQAALDAARDDPEQLMLVADYAERAGNLKVAQAGFYAATEVRGDLLPAFQRLLALAQAEGDTAALNTTLQRMARQWPNESSVQNDLAYTDLLLNKNIPEATQTAEALFAKTPASLPHRMTLALARLRNGKAPEAVAVLDHLEGDFGPLAARKSAIQAAALWANGQKDEASTVLENVKLEQLLQAERDLVEKIK